MSTLEALPEVHDQWRAVLRDSRRVVDAELLEQCLPRIAAAHRAAGGALAPIEELDPRPRAAAEFVDQYAVDQNGITAAQRERLAEALAPRDLGDFAFAIWLQDADVRARVLLGEDGAGTAEPPDAPMPALHPGRLSEIPVADAGFSARMASFLNTVHACKTLDLETAELARLRNAVHQQCLL